MEFLPSLVKTCLRAWARRPPAGRLVCALLLMAAAAVVVSAVSPADDDIQPTFAEHKFCPPPGKDLSRADHTRPRARILVVLPLAFDFFRRVGSAESAIAVQLASPLQGFACFRGARSPPQV